MMTKWQLAEALFRPMTENPSVLVDSSGRPHTGHVLSIQKEAGSGDSFNVAMLPQSGGDKIIFHVRIID